MENNSIIIEHETNELYKVYKDVKAKTENLKSDYVDLSKKVENIRELYKTEKSKLDTLLKQVSDEKVAWATEKDGEKRKIEEKNTELDNALKVKAETDKKLNEIQVLLQKEVEVREETRRLDLKVKADKTALDAEREKFEQEKKSLEKSVSDHETNKKDFKEKITNLITNFE
jgi:predicted  nucleic acid-binding Zn-ribbon protein